MINESKKLLNNINSLWKDIEKGKLTKNELRTKLNKYSEEISSLHKRSFDDSILMDLSLMIFRLHRLVNLSGDNDKDLKITAIILKEKKNPVYYIFDKRAIKILATNIDWFFPLYQKLEVIAENSNFIYLKENKISNLIFTANIVLDKNKIVIYKKNDDDFFNEFMESVKNK